MTVAIFPPQIHSFGQNVLYLINRWRYIVLFVFGIQTILLISSMLLTSFSWQNLSDIWSRWDGTSFVDLAQNGYSNHGERILQIVWYPLYPILIKIGVLVIGHYFLSALLISMACTYTASIALYELALLDFTKRTAFWSVVFLNIFPTAYFLLTVHTESLFLTLSILAVYFYRNGKVKQSALIALLAAMTRVNGILLLPLFLLEWRSLKQMIIVGIGTCLGLISYLLINFYYFRDPFYFQKPLAEHWYKHFAFPWVSVNNAISAVPTINNGYFYSYFAEIVALVVILFAAIIVFLKIRRSYGIYMLSSLLLFTSTSFIASTPRYMIVLFPLFLLMGNIKNRIALVLLCGTSVGLLGWFSYFFIVGRWAF